MRGTLSKSVVALLLLALAALGGCHTMNTPGIKIQKVEVPVIQVQHCIETKDIPARPEPLNAKKMPTSLEDALRATLAKIGEWTKYGNTVDPVLKGCASADVSVQKTADTALKK